MTTGDFGVAAGALQIFVPSYGLRLVRRFGVSRVGWFVVTSFVSLAALHCLEPMGPTRGGFGPEAMLNCVYGIGSVLLLIGMGHIETLFSQNDRSNSKEKSLSSHWEAHVRKETAKLARANEALESEVARRKRDEAALRECEAQYRFIFMENPEAMWILELRECRFLGVNKAALRLYGFTVEEFMQLTPQNLLPPEQLEEFMKDMSRSYAQVESRGRWQHYRKDQSPMDVEVTTRDFNYAGSPARLVAVTDVSREEQRHGAKFQDKKMELIAQITGGVASHLNVVLKVIEHRASSLVTMVHGPSSAEYLQEISLATTHGNNLSSLMLAASGRQPMELRPLDLNRLVGNLNLILRRLCGETITLRSQCGSNLLPVMGDQQALEQVIVNLTKNAREAMPHNGTVAISTAVVRVEAPPVQQKAESKEFVRLSVRDTGCGMTPELQAHLFEPFFTTKEEASGMGLAGIHGVVRQHGGWIECTSAPDAGTEFRIFLPCIPESMLPSASEMQAASATDRGTVLLVDPDDRSRQVARFALSRHGYRIVEADSAAIAQLLWGGQFRSIDLLLTDVALPEGSGFELATKLRETRPDLKVIYACAEAAANQSALPADCTTVSKPYQIDSLIESVEKETGGENWEGRAENGGGTTIFQARTNV